MRKTDSHPGLRQYGSMRCQTSCGVPAGFLLNLPSKCRVEYTGDDGSTNGREAYWQRSWRETKSMWQKKGDVAKERQRGKRKTTWQKKGNVAGGLWMRQGGNLDVSKFENLKSVGACTRVYYYI